ncbi:surface protease GP63 [Trypanosoma cruzi Dm28c]|uniref:Surface protease GP63 n=1 Tax=Trypanosoma cruzi Dm28c TaxID=1416333 RepID=V5BCB4_TRYCR|nr:surface protease GP63 [Trypanosoma cruzi Dm28c]
MFCDAKDTETPRCTSERRHVGTCTASIVEDKGILVDKDVCPVVSSEFHEISSGTTYRTCSDENVDCLRGSLTGGGSWCLDAELLETKDGKHKSVKGVCAQVSCVEGTVRVRHLGSSVFPPCTEDTEIPVTLKYFQKGGKIKSSRTARCAPLPRTAAVLSSRVRWWVERVTSKRRKRKSLRLLKDRLLRRILVHSCLVWRLVPPLKRSLPVLRLRVSLVVAFMPVRGVIRGADRKRGQHSAARKETWQWKRGSQQSLRPRSLLCAIARRGRCTSGGRRAREPAEPPAPTPATPIPSVNSGDFQAIPDALVQQADSDCCVAAATAGLVPFVLLGVVAAAVVVVPL